MKKINYLLLAIMALGMFNSCLDKKKETVMTKAIDPANMDLTIKPGNNFYEFSNGGWIKANPIPPEYSVYGAFTVIYEQNEEQLKSLVEEVSADSTALLGSVNQKIRDMYNSGMDSARIEELGVNALKDYLEAIDALQTKQDVQEFVATLQQVGIYPLFYFFSSADDKNSNWEIANFYQGGLGLPDVDYYINPDERSAEMRAAYVNHITKMFILRGADDSIAAKSAQKVMDIETRLAKVSKSRLERRDPNANYNKMSLSDLKALSPGFDWDIYFDELGVSGLKEINVGQTEFIAGISPIMNDFSVDDWKDYLNWKLLDYSADYLSNAFVNQNFEFFGKTLSGNEELRARWKRVLGTTSDGLGEAIGQIYVEKYFPPESKARMVELVENLRLAFGERIKNLDWMDDSTKQRALDKLAAITVKIGYPDKWRDYSTLEIVPDNYLVNVLNANKFEFKRNIEKIGKKVDKTEWGMTPQTVNAYYNPTNNEIVFPAGILQPPFFNKDADDAVNYGAIGVVIGHEMTHGFDDQGRQYDAEGNLNDWWTAGDAERFTEKTVILAKQYDNYTILDSLHVDGQLTMGENIADLGGLNIAYDALQMSYNGKQPEDIDGYTADQRFFLGYGQIWRQNIRDKELMRRLKEDVHSPGDARVNVPIFNLDVFVESFNITPDQELFIPVEERAYIW
jgi:putative endopeptidase